MAAVGWRPRGPRGPRAGRRALGRGALDGGHLGGEHAGRLSATSSVLVAVGASWSSLATSTRRGAARGGAARRTQQRRRWRPARPGAATSAAVGHEELELVAMGGGDRGDLESSAPACCRGAAAIAVAVVSATRRSCQDPGLAGARTAAGRLALLRHSGVTARVTVLGNQRKYEENVVEAARVEPAATPSGAPRSDRRAPRGSPGTARRRCRPPPTRAPRSR